MAHFEDVMELCKKRGILYPSAELYGGTAGFYDYGSTGTSIKRKLENAWRAHFLDEPFTHEVETAIVMPKRVFQASGHLSHFFDPIAKCACGGEARADHLLQDVLGESFEGLAAGELEKLLKKHKLVCPKCKKPFTSVEEKNMMFPAGDGFLRPETAQGPYTVFKREFQVNRKQLPLGLAIIGKAYRNEISPRQGVIRMREFTQAELQIFFNSKAVPKPKTKGKLKGFTAKDVGGPFFYYYLLKMAAFFDALGLKYKARKLSEEEKAFYNKVHIDFEVFMPSFDKYVEVAGFHYRADHDLKGHSKVSNEKIRVEGETPHVLELSFGVDRLLYSLLDQGFDERGFALPEIVAPYKAGVFPLVNKDGLQEKAREVFLKVPDAFYDEGGSIGKRYARIDEVGVPFGITIDHDTLKNNTVTVRERKTKNQKRVKIAKLGEVLCK